MRCIYCDKEIEKQSLYSVFVCQDKLCVNCRNKLIIKHEYIEVNEFKVESFYDYDGMYRDLLLQYKECFDEALAEVFSYKISDYLAIKYFGYNVVFVPSSKDKLKQRGFNHLELMFKDLNLKKVDGLAIKTEMLQEGKNLKQRKQIIDNFIYTGEKLNKVLIIDDVITSGSSIYGVFRALKPYCRKIRAVALANKKTLSF